MSSYTEYKQQSPKHSMLWDTLLYRECVSTKQENRPLIIKTVYLTFIIQCYLRMFFSSICLRESEGLKITPRKEASGQAAVLWEEGKKRAIRLGKARDLSRKDWCLRNLLSMQRSKETDVIVMYVRGDLIPSLLALKNKRNTGIWKSWFGMSNLRQIYKALIFQRGWSASSEM